MQDERIFFMNVVTGTWHLHRGSSLLHEYHVRHDEDVIILKQKDLSNEHRSTLNILFRSGVSPTVISNVMTDLVHMSWDKKGDHRISNLRYLYWNFVADTQKTFDLFLQ